MPLYSNLANTSQVELTTTPKYHPIMPLLAMPGWTYEDGIPVDKTSWISDVEDQVSEGLICSRRAPVSVQQECGPLNRRYPSWLCPHDLEWHTMGGK